MEIAYQPGQAKARYEKLSTDRQSYLERARKNALLTIPSLVPQSDDEEDKDRQDKYPYQSIGSRGVNNLASKLLMSLYPPNSPFYRFKLSDKTEAEIAEELGEDDPENLRENFERGLQKAESIALKDLESIQLRSSLFETFKHLLVAGNVCLHDQDKSFRLFGLWQFVVKRASSGGVLEAIIKERVAPAELPEEFFGGEELPEEDVELYTHIRKVETGWEVYQEASDKVIPGSDGTFKDDKLPYMFARMVKVDGADYGRSYVEEHYGDLFSLEQNSQAQAELAQIARRLLVLVNPNGMTDETDIQEAENGEIISGIPEDVHMLQAENVAQMDSIRVRINELRREIAEAFLMNNSIQRDAERVTAEEVRMMAAELEAALGGVYTLLSQELMLPIIQLRINSLQKRKILVLPDEAVDLKIVVGVDALGRGHDLNRLRGWLTDVAAAAQIFPDLPARCKPEEILSRITTAHGLTHIDLLITQEEAAAAQAAEQQQQLLQSAAPGVAQEVAKGVVNAATANPDG